jgi:hypothetical protein
MQGFAFIASDTLASVSCLDSGNLVHVSSTWTGDIPPELSQEVATWIHNVIKQAQDCIKKTQNKKQHNIDLYKRPIDFKVKDKVFILIKN